MPDRRRGPRLSIPIEATRSDITPEQAAVIRERIRPLYPACYQSTHPLETLMLSCYYQGLLDGAAMTAQGAEGRTGMTEQQAQEVIRISREWDRYAR